MIDLNSSIITGSLPMGNLVTISAKENPSRWKFFRWITMASIIVVTASAIIGRPSPSGAFESSGFNFNLQPDHVLQAFDRQAVMPWELNNALRLGSELFMRYESHMGSGKTADLEKRSRPPEAYPVYNENLRCNILLANVCLEFSRPFQEEISLPVDDKKELEVETPEGGPVTTLSFKEEFRVYLVRREDSLWKIAKQFGMKHERLAKINELNTGKILQVGLPLKVKVSPSRELTLDITSQSMPEDQFLLSQIRTTDGHPVPRWMLKDFVIEIAKWQSPKTEKVIAGDGVRYPAVVVNFWLVKNLMELKARKFQSIVLTQAAKFDLDPALIMAMIHTESAFNPLARSKASAYGLMQLVPQTAGKEAYYRIYGQERDLTPEYLYDPNNNVELGAAYLNILRDGYLGSITDPTSRTYCAVAAYHAGPSSVGRAFTHKPSLKLAAPVINKLSPADVYKRLVEALPRIESRNYVRKVIARFKKYSGWYTKEEGVPTSTNL